MKPLSSPVALVGGKRKRVSRADLAVAEAVASERQTARLVSHGGVQSVRLPKEFRLPGTEVRIWKDGKRVVLEPIETGLDAVFAAITDRQDAARAERQPMPKRSRAPGLPEPEPVTPRRVPRKRP